MTIAMPSSAQYQSVNYVYPAGFDGGNSDSCFSTTNEDGQDVTVTIPSTVEKVTGDQLALLRSAIHGTNAVRSDYTQDVILTFRGVTYYVGDLVYRQYDHALTQKGDRARYTDVQQLVRLLATSALAIHDQHYEMNLVTTTPVDYHSRELRTQIRDLFDGIHVFTINDVEREATIHVKKVMVEGPPAMSLYGTNSTHKRRLIIDGGGYTTEFIMLDGHDPVAGKCTGIKIGVEDVAAHVFEQVRALHRCNLTTRNLHDILRAYGSQRTSNPGQYPEISCGTHILSSAELAAIVKEGCQNVGEKTLALAASLWGTVNNVIAGDVPYQYHVGGSALFYNDVLRTRMPNLAPVARAEHANAQGAAFIARMLSRG